MKVGPFFGQDETSDETNTTNIFHNFGSNETMQKGSSFDSLALADFSKKFGGSKILKIGTFVLHQIIGLQAM